MQASKRRNLHEETATSDTEGGEELFEGVALRTALQQAAAEIVSPDPALQFRAITVFRKILSKGARI